MSSSFDSSVNEVVLGKMFPSVIDDILEVFVCEECCVWWLVYIYHHISITH